MDSKTFMMELEELYGPYKAGMGKAIIDGFNGVNSTNLESLVDYIKKYYDGMRPPSLSKVYEYAQSCRVSVSRPDAGHTMSKCETCGQLFDVLEPFCKSCRKSGDMDSLMGYRAPGITVNCTGPRPYRRPEPDDRDATPEEYALFFGAFNKLLKKRGAKYDPGRTS